jgi:hypothetical protein
MRHESYKEPKQCCNTCKHLVYFGKATCCTYGCAPPRSLTFLMFGEPLTVEEIRSENNYILANNVSITGCCDCFCEK